MNQDFSEEIVIEKRGGLGVITLNRPQALNAITLEMIRQMSAALRQWESDKTVKTVIFRGAGGKAFSAGGDLKMFHRAGMDLRKGHVVSKVPAVFFGEEYSLNKQIFHYPKPTIAFMNGITMGGGFGIAGNCSRRIATDKAMFAMPEVGIGFFPDVGSVYHLLRAPHSMGRYLGLTGLRVTGADMVHAKLAEYFMSVDQENAVLENLAISDLSPASIDKILSEMASPPPETDFSKGAAKIDSVFRIPSVYAIFAVLDKDASPWAKETADIMRKRAPASVLVTAAYFQKSANASFDEIIGVDFTLAQRFLERMDLYEGIRAVLIDKDYAPRWDPPTFEELSEELIEEYFSPTGHGLGDIEIFAA